MIEVTTNNYSNTNINKALDSSRPNAPRLKLGMFPLVLTVLIRAFEIGGTIVPYTDSP